jgi:predicted RNA binding protein YcfA (HicA-like mRNA interferase family)
VSYSRRKVLKALKGHGFAVVREGKRHTIVRGSDGTEIAVPRHNELRRGTVRGIAEDANVAWNDFQADIT